jgi:hypothetical protein
MQELLKRILKRNILSDFHFKKSFLFFQFCILLILFSINIHAQVTQTIRGKVIDKETKTTLPGASVILLGDSTNLKGVATDENGNFRLENVPVGRQSIRVSYIGYKEQTLYNVIVSSAKELVLTIELEESISSLKEVEITATKKDQPINEMATVSVRAFDVEETERYAGSRGDPARMASNFAGVQGSDDSRNDIVVRGNSPVGTLWRVEGIDVPNPNHFAVAGTTGGPVSILNNKVIANSDFMTGAFPAEYGNTVSGVFDVRFRNGNNEKYEYTGQFGFLGTELTLEGPVSKKNGSSFLINYRYSTLRMFEALKIKIGTSAVPNYQDGAFKLNFPTKKGALSFWGFGGLSNIDILVSTYENPQEELYGDKDRDQYFSTNMGVVGMTYTTTLGSKTFSKLVIAQSYNQSTAHHDKVYWNSDFKVDSLKQILGYNLQQSKQSAVYTITHKFNAQHSLKTGIIAERFYVNYIDTVFNTSLNRFVNRMDSRGETYFTQAYVQWKYKITDVLTLNTGLHAQQFFLNNSNAIEPRAGLRWDFAPRQALSFGYGLHSQMQPLYIYYHHLERPDGSFVQHNKNIGFTRSHHYVLAYDLSLGKAMRFRTEVYYQNLFNVPIETKTSAFSMVNSGTGFSRLFPTNLANRGTGENYGVEFTLERFFSKSFFFLTTVSLYQSKYRGSDNVWRDTDFNGNFVTNFLIGKEFKISKHGIISLGNKTTWAGGRRYGPVDLQATMATNEIVFVDKFTNARQFRDYFRTDLKINYRSNRPKVTHEVGLDLVNILNTKNILTLTYAPDPRNPTANPIREEYQLGFLPQFYYKIDF